MRRSLSSSLLCGLFCSALYASGQANPTMYGEIILASSGAPQVAHASAATCSQLTFACLYPAFLKDEIPAYWQYASPTSPANYDKAANDYLSQFTSPSGIHVRVVVKSPVTTTEYDVPPISPTESVNQYFHNAFYDDGKLRTTTVITLPKNTYNFAWGVYSTCNGSFNWNLPVGLKDVVIEDRDQRSFSRVFVT